MAAVVTYVDRVNAGNRYYDYHFTVAFDNSYPTGGEAVTFPQVREIKHVDIESGAAYQFAYDRANGKIVVNDHDSEVANAADLSALTAVRVRIRGR